MPTSTHVRSQIREALSLDLVGPDNQHPFAHELLRSSPRRWYLTGFLVPFNAPLEARKAGDGELEQVEPGTIGSDEENEGSDSAPQVSYLPSSFGLTVLVGPDCRELSAVVRWGDYLWENPGQEAEPSEDQVEAEYQRELVESIPEPDQPPAEQVRNQAPKKGYRRIPREETVRFELPAPGTLLPHGVPNSAGLYVEVGVQQVPEFEGSTLPPGSRAVSVFVVNRRETGTVVTYQKVVFQVELELQSETGFQGRPDMRGLAREQQMDPDERLAALHYRDVLEYATGHGVAAEATLVEGRCTRVATCWIPAAEVERVDHASGLGMELGMETLGALPDAATAQTTLSPVAGAYGAWIETQHRLAGTLEGAMAETAQDLVRAARVAHDRILEGIGSLQDPDVLEAFRTANRAMARAARQRRKGQAPHWRPFQLAFLLMNLTGMAQPDHPDRQTVDLLFFPTGGGKTEAYFGLAAFTLVLRRLRNPGVRGCGVSVLMRYTLRLLTLDQLGRAAALICALELERDNAKERLGTWPFEIGLWVGSAATPNRMGRPGDKTPGSQQSAYARTVAYKNQPDRRPSPVPISDCPWCGTGFTPDSFQFTPNDRSPEDLRLACVNPECEFSSANDRFLPVVAVDEPLYRRLPCFLIATVDKFAALPWVAETGGLFGRVQRHDTSGFYGPSTPNTGQLLPGGHLPPPDLIIQDELHLISGPLGTIAGVYETAIEALCDRSLTDRGPAFLPKIVASTATVRRANRQIRALFGRAETSIFPAPGVERSDSFFAQTVPVTEQDPGRLYLGVAAQGRSMKVLFLRVALALMSSAARQFEHAGRSADNPADPYLTLLSYFNSLRELGGTRRIVEDEVHSQLRIYWKRRRVEPEDTLFAGRQISRNVTELTSRESTNAVSKAKMQLGTPFTEAAADSRVDVALATNMISVGLDITRLGLMVVFGQPKTSSEYIQATSRVGRDKNRPGLVVTLMNMHRPRDRSHYERFGIYHRTFYRSVEATSVTPFAPRALDRALAAATVGLLRHGIPELEPSRGAQLLPAQIARARTLIETFRDRVRNHDVERDPEDVASMADHVFERADKLISQWAEVAAQRQSGGTGLKYQPFEPPSDADQLLRGFLDPQVPLLSASERAFCANRSMRDIEGAVNLHPTNELRDTNEF